MRSLLGRFHRPMSRGAMGDMLTMNSLGDGSTLSLDFTTGVLDSRLTFTRSTTATYINSSGYVTSAAINAPRFDYSPTTIGEPRGLLIEGQTQNYITNSSALTGYSNSNMASVTSGSETNPEGTVNSALQIYASAGASAYHGYYLSLVAGTNTQITVSIWAKARSYTHLFFGDLASGRSAVRFNLSTGVTDNNFGLGYVSAKATAFPNGWWRCEMVVNVTASTSYGWSFAGVPVGATLNNYGAQYAGTGNAADGIYCYGFSVEGGSGASSYIPTGASGVTRTTDSCLMSGTNFSSWFNNTEGTCLFVGDNSFIPAASNFATNWALISAANSLRINNYTRHTSGRLGASARDSGGTALTFDSPSGSSTNITTTAVYKTAFALKTNDFAYCVNGNTVGLGDGNGVFETVTSIEFARDAIRNGHIKQFKFFPTRLPNAQLQTLTAS